MTKQRGMYTPVILSLVLALVTLVPASAEVNFILNPVDPPGVGFNDPTPATPVGGNPGMTLGEQRLNLFQFAADLWGSVLQGDVDIVIQATFVGLPCTPTSATLGAAGTIQIFANFPNAALPNTWYHSALANQLAGVDLTPGPPDPGFLVPPFNDDIVTLFNSLIDSDPNCLGGRGWYYGYDNNPGNGVDFLNVLMHEFAHGLGFSEFISESTGEGPLGLPDVYSTKMRDLTLNETWNNLTGPERLTSQVNTANLVWDGENVNRKARRLLGPRPSALVLDAKGLRSIETQPASFGPPLRRRGGPTGLVALVDDETGQGADGCEEIQNNVHGRIALIDRGACSFTQKVANAQDAGAKAVLIANSQPKGLPPMGGSDPNIVIPSVGISQGDGDAIKERLSSRKRLVLARLFFDRRFRAGTTDGKVRLFAPDPVQPGSSKSHWDITATPNLLMEPSINSDLAAAENLDLTPFLFLDIGWELAAFP